jgi:hypothetical protein
MVVTVLIGHKPVSSLCYRHHNLSFKGTVKQFDWGVEEIDKSVVQHEFQELYSAVTKKPFSVFTEKAKIWLKNVIFREI